MWVSKVFKANIFLKLISWMLILGTVQTMWRSIFASGAVIREGHGWRRIENGEKINVWGQPWLQSKGNTFVSSTVPHGLELMKVSSLIDHASLSWRLDIMSQILNTNDINHIQNIPLLNVDLEDEKIWKFIAHGLYTVKSSHGDPILRQQFQSRRAMESGWSLRVSPKIKHLSWRILRDYLPSRQNLIRKGVIYQPNCTFCENGLENELHIFFGCSQAISVWIQSGIWTEIQQKVLSAQGIKTLLFDLIQSLPQDTSSELVTML